MFDEDMKDESNEIMSTDIYRDLELTFLAHILKKAEDELTDFQN